MNSDYLQTALNLAHNAIGVSAPNPRVGCVLVREGCVIGQGFTQAAGQAHAEVMALRDAQARGEVTVGATAYVTLEPCSHHGRTPPCVLALVEAKVARVVVACLDPNPQVAGSGVAQLRAAGIEVWVLPSDHGLARAAFDLNVGFMRRMTHGAVFTRLKWAQSADGKTALADGRSQWITGGAARADGHVWRARADVLVTGIGTVLADNPQLNVRGVALVRPPVKCVLDTWARVPLGARLFEDGGPVWVVCAQLEEGHPMAGAVAARLALLQEAHPQVQVWRAPLVCGDLDGQADVVLARLDLAWVWRLFFEQSFNEVHVEAGATVNGAVLAAGLVDELLMYVAPRVLGSGVPAALCAPNVVLDDLGVALNWGWQDVARVGDDVRLVLRRCVGGGMG